MHIGIEDVSGVIHSLPTVETQSRAFLLANHRPGQYSFCMEIATFDTHDFVKRLTGAGMPEAQAEILAAGQSHLIQKRLATKQDLEGLDTAHNQSLKELELVLKHELEAVKAEFKHELEAIKAEFKHELEAVKAEFKHELEAVKAEFKQELEVVKAEFKQELEVVKAEFKQELEAVKAEFKQELETFKAGLEQKLNKQETATRQLELTLTHKIEGLEQKLTIRLGAMLVVGITVLAVLDKIL